MTIPEGNDTEQYGVFENPFAEEKAKNDDLPKPESDASSAPKKTGSIPTLTIGLGGSGIKACDNIKSLIKRRSGQQRNDLAFLGFDCNDNEVESLKYLVRNSEVFSTTIGSPKTFFERNEICHPWAIQSSFPGNARYGAGQQRQVSRMCFFRHFKMIRSQIENKINQITATSDPLNSSGTKKLDVYIISSLCGGAGSGMYTDIAVIVKDIAKTLGLTYNIIGLFVTADVYIKNSQIKQPEYPSLRANTYACLKEIQYLQDPDSPHILRGTPLEFNYPDDDIQLDEELFTLVLLLQSINRQATPTISHVDQLTEAIANVIYLMSETPMGAKKETKWCNPGQGFNRTGDHYKGSIRCFSSPGYGRFIYPGDKIRQCAYFILGESTLKILLDFIDTKVSKEDARKNPKLADLDENIRKMAEEEVESEWDEDILISKYRKKTSYWEQSEIEKAIVDIAENNDWEEIEIYLNEYISDLKKDINAFEKGLDKIKNEKIKAFDNFLSTLPQKFIKNSTGIRHLSNYLKKLEIELDEEETQANAKRDKAIENQSFEETAFDEKYSNVKNLLLDKPFWRGKAKLKGLLKTLSIELCEWLNETKERIIIEKVIDTYQQFDKSIYYRSKSLDKICNKFSAAHDFFKSNNKMALKELRAMTGEKHRESNHMEFNVLSMKDLEADITNFLKKNSPYDMVKRVFINDKDDDHYFWKYKDGGFTKDSIVKIIEAEASPLLDQFNKSLFQVIGDDEKFVNEIVKPQTQQFTAQWKIVEEVAECQPEADLGLAYPKELAKKDSAISTSDQAIDFLKIEYGITGPLLSYINTWKDGYDRVREKGEGRDKNSLHIFPMADYWPEVNVHKKEGDEETLQLFALGLAFGYLFGLDMDDNENIKQEDLITKDEREKLQKIYKTKKCRPFIFRTGTWYYIMPYYNLQNDNSLNESDIKPPESLGNNRKKAFDKFKKGGNDDVICTWITNRILDKNTKNIVNLLQKYMNQEFTEVNKKNKSPQDQALMNKEHELIKQYIELVDQNNTLHCPGR